MFTKRGLIKKFAYELAYLQLKADYWYYRRKNQDMSSHFLNKADELKAFGVLLNIPMQRVYDEAKKIYDFSNSGKKGHEPDLVKIDEMTKYFSKWHIKRPFGN